MIVVLDSGPLGVLSSPKVTPVNDAAQQWLIRLTAHGHLVITSAICDYEVRRELLRSRQAASIERLNAFLEHVGVMPVSEGLLLRAAQLWADARNRGMPTADPFALDADVILAAQAQLLAEETSVPVVVATTNARHLTQFVDARGWQQIGH